MNDLPSRGEADMQNPTSLEYAVLVALILMSLFGAAVTVGLNLDDRPAIEQKQSALRQKQMASNARLLVSFGGICGECAAREDTLPLQA